MRELRILEAITPSRVGGAEVLVADLCEWLPKLGPVHVELFCPARRPFVDYLAKRQMKCTSWKTHGKLDPFTVFRFERLIRRMHADVIHTHLSTASLLGAFAAKLAGIPSVAHVHGLNTATCYRYSTAIIAVSEAVKRHLCAQGISESRIHVVHNGVNLDRFTPMPIAEARNSVGLDSTGPVVGVFGRLSGEKGQMTALEGISILCRDYPAIRLLVVGDGRDQTSLESAAGPLGIAGNVEFRPFQMDVRRLMSACDVVLVPSRKEGFGLTAIEGMALERPVVASDSGGLREIVVPGETGILFRTGDPYALAESVRRIIEDSSAAEQMGKQGRMRVQEHFEFGKQARLLLHVLGRVAERASVGASASESQ